MGTSWRRPPARLAAKLGGGIPDAERTAWTGGLFDNRDRILTFVFDRSRIASSGCWEWQLALNEQNGYPQTNLRPVPGKRPHQLVAWALGWKIEGLSVCHHCDNKRCVRPDHLFVGTALDNHLDCVRKGRHSPPPKTLWSEMMKERPHHWQKISREQIPEIRTRLANGETHASIATRFGVGRQAITKIARGERWAHV